MENDYENRLKMLIIGDSSCGKTSMLIKYADNKFSPIYMSTIGIDFKIKHVTVQNKRYRLHIWDTAGQERFRTITRSYYRGCQGIIMVYDITQASSLKNIESWVKDISINTDANVAKILVGNKSDLIFERAVSYEDGENIARKHQMRFFETSAKNGTNIDEIFSCLVNEIIKKNTNQPNPKPNPKPPNLRSSWFYC
jgi:small GTP-binding protein